MVENLYRCPACSHELRWPTAPLCECGERMEWIPEAAPAVRFRGLGWQTKVPVPGGGWTDRTKPPPFAAK